MLDTIDTGRYSEAEHEKAPKAIGPQGLLSSVGRGEVPGRR